MDYKALENEQLVEKLQANDVKALAEIYNRYWLKLYTLALAQTGNNEEAEDLIHNLFESLWKKRHDAKIRNLTTYLIVSVQYLTIAYIKSQINLRKYQEYLIFQEIQRSSIIEDILNFADLQKAVDSAMKKLPEKTMVVFRMSRFEEKTVREIAEKLSLSEKAVEYHITKSLKVLKEHLNQFNNSDN
jgi:RNA polymerase sigma-70 factor (ECF subfamily)